MLSSYKPPKGLHQLLKSSVQSVSSVTQSCPTLCDPMNGSTPGLPVHHQLPESTQTHVHRVGDASSHLILCRPLLLLPSLFPSIRVFSGESALGIRWPKYWASASVLPMNIQGWFHLGWQTKNQLQDFHRLVGYCWNCIPLSLMAKPLVFFVFVFVFY